MYSGKSSKARQYRVKRKREYRALDIAQMFESPRSRSEKAPGIESQIDAGTTRMQPTEWSRTEKKEKSTKLKADRRQRRGQERKVESRKDADESEGKYERVLGGRSTFSGMIRVKTPYARALVSAPTTKGGKTNPKSREP
jgi:hypothetical protein